MRIDGAARASYHRSKTNQTNREDKGLAETPEAHTSNEETGGDDSLQGLVRDEHEHARERLTQELGRDPTEDEIDEWLRQQTEGY